jgi:very-short-patch-repair endonuclease
MRPESANPDSLASRIASRQHGAVTSTQLNRVGIDSAGIARRLRKGRLHRLYRGVYAVGHKRLSNEGRWMASVLACGEGAVLSHRGAAELWGLLKPQGGLIHVTIPNWGVRKKRPGIHLHRSPSLQKNATTRRDGIAVTTPARTLTDLRRVASVDELRRAIREAEFNGLDVGDARKREPVLTRSGLERRFQAMCRRHRLPRPEVNVRIAGFEVDFLWRERKLVVETDGFDAHSGREAFEADRAKDAELRVNGFTVVRFTYRHVTERWAWVEQTVRALLSLP